MTIPVQETNDNICINAADRSPHRIHQDSLLIAFRSAGGEENTTGHISRWERRQRNQQSDSQQRSNKEFLLAILSEALNLIDEDIC